MFDAKRKSLVVVDDVVNGIFHTSALEGLAMAKPVINYVDPWYDYLVRMRR